MVHPPPPTHAARLGGLCRRLGWSLWPPRCLICGEAGSEGRDLCPGCAAAWPWLGPACLRCAMPLAATSSPVAMPFDGADVSAAASQTVTPAQAASLPLPGAALLPLPAAASPPLPGTTTSAVAGPPSPTLALCGSCLRRPPLLTQVHAACAYRAPIDRLLPRFKFHRDLAAGRLLATMMAHSLASRPPAAVVASACTSVPARASASTPSAVSIPILIPIPLHRARLRERGYDQALELARPLARRLRLPLWHDGLIRSRDTPAQSRLDAAARRRNLRDAFCWSGAMPAPAHVVLIDDVMTTGATLHAAARSLRRAGVARIDAWVCARVI